MGSETSELRPPKGSWGSVGTRFGEAGHRSTSLVPRRELVGNRLISVMPELPSAGSFSQYLVQASADSCRFLVRTCKQQRRPRTRGARLIATFVEDPLDLVMEQRMLRTVRRLAERRGV